jgi:hypothetical protein
MMAFSLSCPAGPIVEGRTRFRLSGPVHMSAQIVGLRMPRTPPAVIQPILTQGRQP